MSPPSRGERVRPERGPPEEELPGFQPASQLPPPADPPTTVRPSPAGDAEPMDPSARVPLGSFAIHPKIVEVLRAQGIEQLYPPQAMALGPVLSGKSVLVSCPTSAGKSLIAYVALVQGALEGRRGLYIVPLRALASEKFHDLEPFRALGLKIGLTMGEHDLSTAELESVDILVSTSEKADSLLRHRNPWMDRVGVVVADEIHLLREPGRGPTLEVSLTRMRRRQRGIQVIGLSATVGNARALADWLGAVAVLSPFRPVPLHLGVYREGVLTFLDGSEKPHAYPGTPVEQLVRGALAEGGQALVFVNSRRSSVSLANTLSRRIGRTLSATEREALEGVVARLAGAGEEETEAVRQLQALVPNGVAFHNASLTNEERSVVERAFRAGVLKCLVATTTLAMGLNLPARRVIVRDTTRYEETLGAPVALPAMEVQQMCGRAGRPRYDPYGEAVLLARDPEEELELRERYLTAPPEDVDSRLASLATLRTHLLALVASGEVRSWEGVEEFFRATFYGHEEPLAGLSRHLREAQRFLERHQLLRPGDPLKATDFGHLTSDLYLDPVTAVLLRRALGRAGPTTPTFAYLAVVAATPDLAPLYLRSGEEAEITARYLDDADELLLKPEEDELVPSEEGFLGSIKTALLLEAWLDDRKTLVEVTQAFRIGAGDLRTRVERAEWLVSSLAELARRGRRELARSLDRLSVRVRYGVREELVDLVLLRGIGRVRSRRLYEEGIVDQASLAATPLSKLTAVLGSSSLAESVRAQAQARYQPRRSELPPGSGRRDNEETGRSSEYEGERLPGAGPG